MGGGDGGVLRFVSVCCHNSSERCASMKESKRSTSLNWTRSSTNPSPLISQMVIETSKKFLPAMAVGFSDPRVQIHIGDGKLLSSV